MKRLRLDSLQDIAAIAIALVFLYAAHEKIEQPVEFARAIYHYRMIGPNAVLPPLIPNLLAVTLPWIEVLAGVLLLRGAWRREAALLTALMLAVFIVAVGYTLFMGIDVANCGCFSLGEEGRKAGWKLIGQDALMLVFALWIARAPARREITTRMWDGSRL